MEIRKAKISDAQKIKELYRELREYELSLLEGDIKEISENMEFEKTEANISKIIKSRNSIIFVAENDNKPVGFITGRLLKGIKYYQGTFDIYIRNSFRGKNIGTELMHRLFAWFKKKGCKSSSVEVYSANEKAKAFYKKQGFKPAMETYKIKIY